MAKRVGSECDTLSPQTKVKKNCGSFKLEWPSEYVQIEAQAEKLGENFSFLSEKGLLYKTCSGANVVSEFSHGKIWTKWKLDYLKRHIQQKSHLNAVGIIRRLKMGKGIGTLLRESANDWEKKNELSHKKNRTLSKLKFSLTIFYLPSK